MNDQLDRLNSLTNKALGHLVESADIPPTTSQHTADTGPTPGRYTHDQEKYIREQLTTLQKRIYNKELLMDIAWLCPKCNTVNGFAGTRKEAKKTCGKCRQPRREAPLVKEVLFEIMQTRLEIREDEIP